MDKITYTNDPAPEFGLPYFIYLSLAFYMNFKERIRIEIQKVCKFVCVLV